MNENENNIERSLERGAIEVAELTLSDYQKDNTKTAVLKQKVTVTSLYPSAVHSSNMQDNMFGKEEFEDKPQEFTSEETRVAFVEVPATASIEQVRAKIPQDAVLYRILSNRPILTDNHINAIKRGLTTLGDMANSQAVRQPAEIKDDAGNLVTNPKAEQLITDQENRVQYRKVFYSNKHVEDIDLRGSEKYPAYMSDELATELNASADGVVLESQVTQPGTELEDQGDQSTV